MSSFLKIASALALSAGVTVVGTGCVAQPDDRSATDEATSRLEPGDEPTGECAAACDTGASPAPDHGLTCICNCPGNQGGAVAPAPAEGGGYAAVQPATQPATQPSSGFAVAPSYGATLGGVTYPTVGGTLGTYGGLNGIGTPIYGGTTGLGGLGVGTPIYGGTGGIGYGGLGGVGLGGCSGLGLGGLGWGGLGGLGWGGLGGGCGGLGIGGGWGGYPGFGGCF
jgi:hypothetical protein